MGRFWRRGAGHQWSVRRVLHLRLGWVSSLCLFSRADRRLASFSHSLPAVGPKYLDRPLLPSIRVPWEPLCCPSSTECRAGLLEPLAPVGTLYRATAILAASGWGYGSRSAGGWSLGGVRFERMGKEGEGVELIVAVGCRLYRDLLRRVLLHWVDCLNTYVGLPHLQLRTGNSHSRDRSLP